MWRALLSMRGYRLCPKRRHWSPSDWLGWLLRHDKPLFLPQHPSKVQQDSLLDRWGSVMHEAGVLTATHTGLRVLILIGQWNQ